MFSNKRGIGEAQRTEQDRTYLYVLSGYAGAEPLRSSPDSPLFEFQRFASSKNAAVVSLSTVTDLKIGLRTKLTPKLLFDRIKLALWVAKRAEDYSAIIASGEDIGVLVALAMRVTGKTTRLIIVTHGPQFKSKKFQLVLSLIKSMRNVVFGCLSSSLADYLIALHGLNVNRCVSTGYGVDIDFYDLPKPETEAIIVSAGVSNRDYTTLVKAIEGTGLPTKIAADSTWVGRNSDHDLAVPTNVECRSYRSYLNLRDLYGLARVVVVPTYDVPFAAGFAVIGEAMATGTAVIACKGTVVSDFVIDGVTGILVPPGDVEALRTAIRKLAECPSLARRMGEAGRARMVELFSLDQYVQRLCDAAEIKA